MHAAVVRDRRDRRRDRDRHLADGRVVACRAPLRQRRALVERAPFRHRPRRLGRGARRPAARPRRLRRTPTRSRRCSSRRSCSSPAVRLMRRNVDVLMDRVPASEDATARRAIAAIEPPVELRRLRMRQAAGRYFADVVIGVSPERRSARATRRPTRSSAAVQAALPEADVVVHVEPRGDERRCASGRTRRRSRSRACARSTTSASSPSTAGTELSLHLKLPGDIPLEDAHAIAEQVERAILDAVPEVVVGADASRAARRGEHRHRPADAEVAGDTETVARIVRRRDRQRSARAPLPPHRRGARRVPHAARRRRDAALPTHTPGEPRSRS